MRFVLASTRKAGHRNQCVGLLDVLNVKTYSEILMRGSSVSDSRLKKFAINISNVISAIAVCLARPMRGTVVIASGQAVIPLCWFLKTYYQKQILVIHVGSPKTCLKCADLLIRSEHQRLLSEIAKERYHWQHRTIWIKGVISSTGAGQNRTGDCVTVLIGGKNKTFRLAGEQFSRFINALRKLATSSHEQDIRLVLSRRTEAATANQLTEELGQLCRIIPFSDREGYLSAIEQARAFVVTPDSVTMVSEACATGKPVFVAELEAIRKDTGNYQMIVSFEKEGYISYFIGDVGDIPLKRLPKEGRRIATEVQSIIEAWKKSQD